MKAAHTPLLFSLFCCHGENALSLTTSGVFVRTLLGERLNKINAITFALRCNKYCIFLIFAAARVKAIHTSAGSPIRLNVLDGLGHPNQSAVQLLYSFRIFCISFSSFFLLSYWTSLFVGAHELFDISDRFAFNRILPFKFAII